MSAPRAKFVVSFWQNLPLTGKKAAFVNFLGSVARPRIDFFLSANEDGRAILQQAGVEPNRIKVLPPVGVDPAWFRPVDKHQLRHRLGFSPEEFVVGFSGRLVIEKGLRDLTSALTSLRASGISIRGLFVGSGPLREELISRSNLFTVVSPASPLESLEYYSAMDCLVLPSHTTPDWKEQFGRSMVEAMCVGVPVIGSSSGAIPEVIASAGMIFPEGDVQALKVALSELCDNRARAHEIGQLGRRRAIENYTNSVIAEQTVCLYRELFSEAG